MYQGKIEERPISGNYWQQDKDEQNISQPITLSPVAEVIPFCRSRNITLTATANISHGAEWLSNVRATAMKMSSDISPTLVTEVHIRRLWKLTSQAFYWSRRELWIKI
jgi:hypothetical protein